MYRHSIVNTIAVGLHLAAAIGCGHVSAAPRGGSGADGVLYGMELMHNSPAEPGLVMVDPISGDITLVGKGPLHKEESATSELGAIDPKRGIYYYLGDTSAGATLVGLSLKDGTEVCSVSVPEFKEIGFVGIGQSLNYDGANDQLLLSGMSSIVVANQTSHGHTILRHDLSQKSCAKFKVAGFYGVADYAPMLHGSALDAAGQRLFVSLSATKSTTAVGIIDLVAKNMTSIDLEGDVPADVMVGMGWDSIGQRIVSLTQGPGKTGINLVTLDPLSGKWAAQNIGSQYPVILGNDGEVAAYDDATGTMTVLASSPGSSGPTGEPIAYVVQVNVRTGKVIGSPPKLGLLGLNLLEQLVSP